MNRRRLSLIALACVGVALLPAFTAAAKSPSKKAPPKPVTRWVVIEFHGLGDIISKVPGAATCLGSVDYTYRSLPIKLVSEKNFNYLNKGAPFYAVWYDHHKCEADVAGISGNTDCKSVSRSPVESFRAGEANIFKLGQKVRIGWRAEFNSSSEPGTGGGLIQNVCNGKQDENADNGIVAPEDGFLTLKYLINAGVPFKGYPFHVSIPFSALKSHKVGSFGRAYEKTLKCSEAGAPRCDIQAYGSFEVKNHFKIVIRVFGGAKPPRLPKLVTPPAPPLPLP